MNLKKIIEPVLLLGVWLYLLIQWHEIIWRRHSIDYASFLFLAIATVGAVYLTVLFFLVEKKK